MAGMREPPGTVVLADLLFPHHPADVVPVGHQGAGKALFAFQDLVEQPFIGSDRYSVDALVAEHEGAAPGFDCFLEGGKEPRTQFPAADICFAGVAAALGFGVAGEMLGGREDGGGVGQSLPLVSADHGLSECPDQVGILSERIVHARPPQVSADAKHGREGPVTSRGRDFDGRSPGALSTKAGSQVLAMPSRVEK
jgi:hypothetical protein